MYKGRAWTCVPRKLSQIWFSLIKETFQDWVSFFIFCKAKFHVVLFLSPFQVFLSLLRGLGEYGWWWSVSPVKKQRSSYWCCISLKQFTLFIWNVHVGSKAVHLQDFIWSVSWQLLLHDGILYFHLKLLIHQILEAFYGSFCPVLRVIHFAE